MQATLKLTALLIVTTTLAFAGSGCTKKRSALEQEIANYKAQEKAAAANEDTTVTNASNACFKAAREQLKHPRSASPSAQVQYKWLADHLMTVKTTIRAENDLGMKTYTTAQCKVDTTRTWAPEVLEVYVNE